MLSNKIGRITEKQGLIIIILISIFLRLLAAVYLGNKVEILPGTADQITYHTLAQRVLSGFGFTFDQPWWPATQPGEPTAHWSYLYTFFLVAIYKIFGINPLIARMLQAIFGGFLQPWLIYGISKKVFPHYSPLFAAGWIAIYTYLIYYSAALMTEAWFITCVLAIFLISLEIVETGGSFSRYLFLGLITGLAVLLRQVFLLIVPFLFLWLLWVRRKQDFKIHFRNMVLAGLVILLMILPFSFYNMQRFNRFVLLNTNAGFAFFWANNPVYGTHFVGILPEEMGNYLDLLPTELKGLDEAALDSELLKRGLDFVIQNPLQYLLLSLSRIPILFQFLPSGQSSIISNIARVTSFGLALPFMLAGIFFSLKDLIRQKKPFFDSPLSIILIFGFTYASIHILTWSLVRYRLPIDALFLIFAGLALGKLFEGLSSKVRGKEVGV